MKLCISIKAFQRVMSGTSSLVTQETYGDNYGDQKKDSRRTSFERRSVDCASLSYTNDCGYIGGNLLLQQYFYSTDNDFYFLWCVPKG
jgi:hypothetical protein